MLHPIQVVARRTGLSADVIRAWERRYNAVCPQRSPTDRRLYTDTDITRLTLLRQVTQAGRRIGDVARLPLEELTNLIQEDKKSGQDITELSTISPAHETSEHLEGCLAAIHKLDNAALDRSLNEASRALGIPILLDEVIAVLLQRIGDSWRTGTLRACHEHMATAQLRFFLGNLLNTGNIADTGPELLVATPPRQRHELGALMVAVTATLGGWKPLYLGPDISGNEIAFAVAGKGIKVVALSISYPADDPRLPDALRQLHRLLPPDVVLLVGGGAVYGYKEVLDEIGARQPDGLPALSAELDRIRARGVSF